MLNALFASVPDVLNVAAVCFMFFLVFAILGVTYFKGILMSCQGKGFDALPEEVVSFIEEPVAWSAMSTEQQAWFGPLSNVSDAFSVDDASGLFTSDSDCAVINGGWPDSAACCPEWPSSSVEAPTSHQARHCFARTGRKSKVKGSTACFETCRWHFTRSMCRTSHIKLKVF